MADPLTPEQYEQIRQLAYQRFVSRGYEEGHDLEDWLSAEQQVLRGDSEGNDDEPQERNVSETPASLVIEQLPQRND